MPSRTFFETFPKVELHVHLEGSIRPETVLKLAEKNGVSLPAQTLEGLKDWFQFRDFPHFVEVYVAVSKCIQTAEDLALVIDEFAAGQAAQNVRHTEVTFTAGTIEAYCGISFAEQAKVLLEGVELAKEKHGVSIRFIIDIVRGDTKERAEEIVQFIAPLFPDTVCALGLAGKEEKGSAKDYVTAIQSAKALGIPFVPHAGETMGPEAIWDVLEFGDPVRIGHGVRAVEDPKLVNRLAQDRIPLEICPSSNVCLGVFKSLSEHSMGELLDSGVVVTINSDDPPMFSTSITQEWVKVAEELELSEDFIYSLTLNAARASLLEPEAKQELIREIVSTWPEETDGETNDADEDDV